VNNLAKARALVHRLLPAYCLFAGRPKKAPGLQEWIQVVTLVHVYMASRESLLDVALEAPDALLQAHFIRMSDPVRTQVFFSEMCTSSKLRGQCSRLPCWSWLV
jgi:hypothetical protein